MMRLQVIALLCTFAFINTTHAQTQVSQSRDYNMAPRDKFTIIGKLAGKTAMCLVRETESEIILYNEKMNEDTVVDLPYLNSKHYNHKFIKASDRLVLVFEERKGDVLKTYYVAYDKTFKILGEPLLLNERPWARNSEMTGYAVSDQKKVFSLYYNVLNKEKEQVVFQYHTFKINGEKLHSNKIDYNVTSTKPDITVLIRDNEEITLLLSLYNNEKKEISGLMYGYGTSKIEALTELEYGSGAYHQLQYVLSEKLNTLSLVMQSKSSSKNGKNYLYKADIDLVTHMQRKATNINLQSDAMQTSASREGFDDYVPQTMLPLNDGSILYVTEYYDFEERGTNRIFRNDLTGMSTDNMIVDVVQRKYTYGDMLCLLINAKNEIQWQKLIHKLQISDNDNGERSSFIALRSKQNIKFLFSPNPNTNDLQQVSMYANGELKYHLLNSLTNTNGTLLCQKAVQVAENEVIVPCVGSAKLGLVRILLNND
jgi:hypothetical protein